MITRSIDAQEDEDHAWMQGMVLVEGGSPKSGSGGLPRPVAPAEAPLPNTDQ